MRAPFLFLCVLLAGCARTDAQPVCPQGLSATRTAELFFGRNIGTSEGVSDGEWMRFVDQEIVPRFPDGFTLSDATGAWRDADGRLARERTKRLLVILKPGDEARIASLRAAYKARFRQESVLLIERLGCSGL